MNQTRAAGGAERYPVWVLYLFGVVLLVIPYSDTLIGLVPTNLASVQWRVGAVGLISGAMLFPLIGLTAIFLAAHLRESKWLRRILEVLCFLAGLITAVTLVLFLLDVIQLRRDINPQMMRPYQIAAAKGALTLLLEAAYLLTLSVVSFRRGRAVEKRQRTAARQRADSVPLMARPAGEQPG